MAAPGGHARRADGFNGVGLGTVGRGPSAVARRRGGVAPRGRGLGPPDGSSVARSRARPANTRARGPRAGSHAPGPYRRRNMQQTAHVANGAPPRRRPGNAPADSRPRRRGGGAGASVPSMLTAPRRRSNPVRSRPVRRRCGEWASVPFASGAHHVVAYCTVAWVRTMLRRSKRGSVRLHTAGSQPAHAPAHGKNALMRSTHGRTPHASGEAASPPAGTRAASSPARVPPRPARSPAPGSAAAARPTQALGRRRARPAAYAASARPAAGDRVWRT